MSWRTLKVLCNFNCTDLRLVLSKAFIQTFKNNFSWQPPGSLTFYHLVLFISLNKINNGYFTKPGFHLVIWYSFIWCLKPKYQMLRIVIGWCQIQYGKYFQKFSYLHFISRAFRRVKQLKKWKTRKIFTKMR